MTGQMHCNDTSRKKWNIQTMALLYMQQSHTIRELPGHVLRAHGSPRGPWPLCPEACVPLSKGGGCLGAAGGDGQRNWNWIDSSATETFSALGAFENLSSQGNYGIRVLPMSSKCLRNWKMSSKMSSNVFNVFEIRNLRLRMPSRNSELAIE